MESFAPWFLESPFHGGHESFHAITTATPTDALISHQNSNRTSDSSSLVGSFDHHAYVPPHHFPLSASPMHILDLYAPYVVLVDIPPAHHQPETIVDAGPRPRRRRQQRPAITRKKSLAPKVSSASLSAEQENSYDCQHPGCGKVFTRPYNLTSHMRTHTSERPYACSQCGRRFARQHDRNRHEKLHWNIKPHVCPNCSKPFARMDALNRHLRVENGCGSAVAAAAVAAVASNSLFACHSIR